MFQNVWIIFQKFQQFHHSMEMKMLFNFLQPRYQMVSNILSLSAATRSEVPKAHLKRVNDLHHHLRVAKVKERENTRKKTRKSKASTSRAPQSSSESEEDTRRKPAGKSRTKKTLRACPSKIDMFGGIQMVMSMRNARVV